MADETKLATVKGIDLSALMVSEEVKKQLQAEKNALVATANSIVVSNNDEYVAAGEFVKKCVQHDRKIHGMFDKLVDVANSLHKGLTGLRTALMVSPESKKGNGDASAVVRQKMSAYTRVLEQKRRDEEQRRREELQQKMEESRDKQAELLDKQGRTEEAVALLDQPVVAPVVVVTSELPKVQGISTRTTWKARVIDSALVPRQFLMVDEKKLNDFAADMKGSMQVAGVEFYEEPIVAVKA